MSVLTTNSNAYVVFIVNTPWFVVPTGKRSIQEMEDFLNMKSKSTRDRAAQKEFATAASVLGRAKQYGGDLELMRYVGGLEAIVSFSSNRDMLSFSNIASNLISGYALTVSMTMPGQLLKLRYDSAKDAQADFERRAAIVQNSEMKLIFRRAARMFECADEKGAKLEKISQTQDNELKVVFSIGAPGAVKELENTLQQEVSSVMLKKR